MQIAFQLKDGWVCERYNPEIRRVYIVHRPKDPKVYDIFSQTNAECHKRPSRLAPACVITEGIDH